MVHGIDCDAFLAQLNRFLEASEAAGGGETVSFWGRRRCGVGPCGVSFFLFIQCGTRKEGSYEASHFQTAFGLRCLCGAGAAGGRCGDGPRISGHLPAAIPPGQPSTGGGCGRAASGPGQGRMPGGSASGRDCLSICATVSGGCPGTLTCSSWPVWGAETVVGILRSGPWLRGKVPSGAPVSVLPK